MKKLSTFAGWIHRNSRRLASLLNNRRSDRRSSGATTLVAAEVQFLEERALLTGTAAIYSIAEAMGWDATAPTYTTNLAYNSAGTWENLKVINYSPSHYVDFNSSGQLTFSDGSVLGDTTFQTNLPTDSPFLSTHPLYGTFVNYIQGNPQLTIYNDLAQLQAAGFDGVRLYADGPQAEIATIMAANQLYADTGNRFYVELEVAVPDLSQPTWYTGTVAQRIQALYNQEVAATPAGTPGLVEGGLQQLHYVINMVGADAFSNVVPLVFFGHEELVQPIGTNAPLTDANSSVPLLQWGINATRAILTYDLNGQANLPSVTTALVAGQVVDVSIANNGEIAKLIDTIQTDTNSPIAYDVYAFQWANNYFQTTAYSYPNDSSVIANAYPPNAAYYDRVPSNWTSGLASNAPPPPVVTNFTPTDAVTNPNLMWSLQWMADRVNWIWGSPGQTSGSVAKQLVAETGWATAQLYTQDNGTGIQVTGSVQDAQTYFSAIQSASFKIGGAPVMYFEAYDEPVKETVSNMYSENHYGIYGWTGLPKFPAPILPVNAVNPPLTQPFAVVTISPTDLQPNGVAQADNDALPTATAYSLQVKNGNTVRPGSTIDVPWFWGTGGFSNGNAVWTSNSVTWMPNPSVLMNNGDVLTITSSDPGSGNPASIQLKFDTAGKLIKQALTDLAPGAAGETLTPPAVTFTAQGSAWQLYTSFPWLHGGSNNYSDTTTFPPVYQDFWGAAAQKVGNNVFVTGTPASDSIQILKVNPNGSLRRLRRVRRF